MSYTLRDVLTVSRELLKDEDSNEYRYSTASLIRYINLAVTSTYNIRPDAFCSVYSGIPSYTEADLDAPFPLPLNFFHPFVFFVTGYAELRNDEFSDDARAKSLLTAYEMDIRGGGVTNAG